MWLRNDLDDNTSAFINCEDSIMMDSSQHLQGGGVPPLNHCYIKATRHRHRSCQMRQYKDIRYDLSRDKCQNVP